MNDKLEGKRFEMFTRIRAALNAQTCYHGGLFDCGELGYCRVWWSTRPHGWECQWHDLEQLPEGVLDDRQEIVPAEYVEERIKKIFLDLGRELAVESEDDAAGLPMELFCAQDVLIQAWRAYCC